MVRRLPAPLRSLLPRMWESARNRYPCSRLARQVVRTRSVLHAGGEPSPRANTGSTRRGVSCAMRPFGVIAIGREPPSLRSNPAASNSSDIPPTRSRGRRRPHSQGTSRRVPSAARSLRRTEETARVEVVTRAGDVPRSGEAPPLESPTAPPGNARALQDLREQKALEEQWRRRDRLASLGAARGGRGPEIEIPWLGSAPPPSHEAQAGGGGSARAVSSTSSSRRFRAWTGS